MNTTQLLVFENDIVSSTKIIDLPDAVAKVPNPRLIFKFNGFFFFQTLSQIWKTAD